MSEGYSPMDTFWTLELMLSDRGYTKDVPFQGKLLSLVLNGEMGMGIRITFYVFWRLTRDTAITIRGFN